MTLEGVHQIDILPNHVIHHPAFLLGHKEPQHQHMLAHRCLLTSAYVLSVTKHAIRRILGTLGGTLDLDELGSACTEGILHEGRFVTGAV